MRAYWFPWCSGYHIRLTRGRSPVRSRAETSILRLKTHCGALPKQPLSDATRITKKEVWSPIKFKDLDIISVGRRIFCRRRKKTLPQFTICTKLQTETPKRHYSAKCAFAAHHFYYFIKRARRASRGSAVLKWLFCSAVSCIFLLTQSCNQSHVTRSSCNKCCKRCRNASAEKVHTCLANVCSLNRCVHLFHRPSPFLRVHRQERESEEMYRAIEQNIALFWWYRWWRMIQ